MVAFGILKKITEIYSKKTIQIIIAHANFQLINLGID